jgi:hypothetical protein
MSDLNRNSRDGTQEESSTILVVPRGKAQLAPLNLEMKRIYEGESRLKEVAYVTPITAQELSSFFNQVCNETTKYEAWIEYEILRSQERIDTIKAGIIIDKMPELAQKLKESGQKPSEDWRAAIVALDPEYRSAVEILNALKAVKMLLHNKSETFKRAYFSASKISDDKKKISATPNLNGNIGQLSDPQTNFMGVCQIDKDR